MENHLDIKANHLFLYYKDLHTAQYFYENTLGLKRVLDFGFASIHQISPTTYVGLVDEVEGMHKASEPKSVTLSFITQEVDGWYSYLDKEGIEMHRPLGDATRHPTRGFVALDPEGYFLEFETFLPHQQNLALRKQLEESEAFYPSADQGTTRPNNLGLQGNVIWLYYQDLAEAQKFYADVMELQLVTDQGFAKVYASSDTGFIGLVDATQGLHGFSNKKAVTVCFFTDKILDWFEHFKNKGVKLHTSSIMIESEAVEIFVAYDVGEYYLEFDRFLQHEKNQVIRNSMS